MSVDVEERSTGESERKEARAGMVFSIASHKTLDSRLERWSARTKQVQHGLRI